MVSVGNAVETDAGLTADLEVEDGATDSLEVGWDGRELPLEVVRLVECAEESARILGQKVCANCWTPMSQRGQFGECIFGHYVVTDFGDL